MSVGHVLRVLRIGRNVADLSRAIAFHRDALGFQAIEPADDAPPAWMRLPGMERFDVRAACMRLGHQEIELTEFHPGGAPYPADSSSADLWFQHMAIVTDNMDATYDRVMRHGATPITHDGPQTLPPSTGSVTAFKFRDPDGHPLELIHFPRGVGDSAWQTPHPGRPTLGIDHIAISVADADCSIAFYTSLLGLSQTACVVNRGPGQERLDALHDVEVDVVALQPSHGATPHVELLGYRTPRGRATLVHNIRDIAADRIILEVENLQALLAGLTDARADIVSSGPVSGVGATYMALLRDPDGHLLTLFE